MLKSCSGPGPKSSHHLECPEVPEGSSPEQVSGTLWGSNGSQLGVGEQSSLCLPNTRGSSLEDCLGVDLAR